jgi:hypothetical protein
MKRRSLKGPSTAGQPVSEVTRHTTTTDLGLALRGPLCGHGGVERDTVDGLGLGEGGKGAGETREGDDFVGGNGLVLHGVWGSGDRCTEWEGAL